MTDAGSDPRFANNAGRVAHQAEIEAMLERALAAHGASAWCEKLAAAGIMHERVNTYTDFLSEPQVDAVGAVAWLDQAGIDRAVPIPNIPGSSEEHTSELQSLMRHSYA